MNNSLRSFCMQSTLAAAALGLVACTSTQQTATTPHSFSQAYQSIAAAELQRHVKTLASDDFQGRQPTTIGEQKTLAYLTDHFAAMGYQPANNGSFLQPVELVEIEAQADVALTIGQQRLTYKTDMVIGSAREQARVAVTDSELVFVGYGITAPEYGWDDYAGIDVKGKTVVVLVNDPGFAAPDGDKFQGKTMTYYGRWTYKYEEASRRGAAAALIVHETKPASYGWSVVANSWSGPQYHLVTPDGNADRIAVEGWLSLAAAEAVFTQAGYNYQALKRQAQQGPTAQALGIKASALVNNRLTHSTSYNFLATLPGSSAPDEHVMYTAHWDHLGKDDNKQGDKIYNGAHDNATGTASLIATARAFAQLQPRPQRSVSFLIVTAEEQGLLGSKYYAANPIYPLNQIVANLNVDAMNVMGKTKDVAVVGFGKSELEQYLAKAAQRQGRHLTQESSPQNGYYYRSDHFSFAKQGIPALYAKGGDIPIDEATAQYRKKMAVIINGCYHQVCDKYRANWDFGGMVEDTQLFFEVGYDIANTKDWPQWHKTSEFRRNE